MDQSDRLSEYCKLLQITFSSSDNALKAQCEAQLSEFFSSLEEQTVFSLQALQVLQDENLSLSVIINLKEELKKFIKNLKEEDLPLFNSIFTELFNWSLKNSLSFKLTNNFSQLLLPFFGFLGNNNTVLLLDKLTETSDELDSAVNITIIRNLIVTLRKLLSSSFLNNSNIPEFSDILLKMVNQIATYSLRILVDLETAQNFNE